MNRVTKFISLILVLSFLLLPVRLFAQDEMMEENPAAQETVDIYGLFWPVVPGTTVAEPTFFFKQLKEGFNSFFTFGEVNKAKYELELSEKRLVEANKLVESSDFKNALKSLKMGDENRAQAIELKRKAQEKQEDISELAISMRDSFSDQQTALEYLAGQFSGDEKEAVSSMANNLTLQISEAQ